MSEFTSIPQVPTWEAPKFVSVCFVGNFLIGTSPTGEIFTLGEQIKPQAVEQPKTRKKTSGARRKVGLAGPVTRTVEPPLPLAADNADDKAAA